MNSPKLTISYPKLWLGIEGWPNSQKESVQRIHFPHPDYIAPPVAVYVLMRMLRPFQRRTSFQFVKQDCACQQFGQLLWMKVDRHHPFALG